MKSMSFACSPKQHPFFWLPCFALLTASCSLALFGCRSSGPSSGKGQLDAGRRLERPNKRVDGEGGSFGGGSGGSLAITRLSKAPLQDERLARTALSCDTVFRFLSAEPRRFLPIRRITWEMRRSDQAVLVAGVIRSYSYADLRLTERIAVARPPRLFGVSYITERHADDWPFEDHLALFRLSPLGAGCAVRISTYFDLPTGWAASKARRRLTAEILPALQRAIEKSVASAASQVSPRP